MSKKVIMTEEKLVDLIYNIVESSLKELDPSEAEVVKEEVKAPAKKVVKITEDRLVTLVEKIVKEQIANKKK